MAIELTGNFESLLAQRKQALSLAVEDLYAVFRQFELRPEVVGCPCCVSSRDQVVIHSKNLRRLTAEDLEKFAQKAMTTWGDADDFRHFLPRLFELVAHGELAAHVESEIVFGKLADAHWEEWPEDQCAAIKRFFTALWQRVIDEYPCSISDGGTLLCSIANAADDLGEYLAIWQDDDSEPAVCHLVEFIDGNASRIRRNGELVSAFWEERAVQVGQIVAWVKSSSLREHIEQMFRHYERSQPLLAASLSMASDTLTVISSVPD